MDSRHNFAGKLHVLDYPQRPLVSTWASELTEDTANPAGTLCTVAIMCYTGHNQEDSLIFNKGALDRGLFRSSYHRTYRENNVVHGNDSEYVCSIGSSIKSKAKANYSKVGDDGLVSVGQYVSKDDVLINKVIEYTTVQKDSTGIGFITSNVTRDKSVVINTNETAQVTKTLLGMTVDGMRFVTVKTTAHRVPVVGDKFSSRHGQKGIIGNILEQTDMPFTREGIIPDIIINCHAIPSRMTIGQISETLAGKLAALSGKLVDGTPFRGVCTDSIVNALEGMCFDKLGTEIMFCGKTGKQLNRRVFIGLTYYQRLKHMVIDKIHARSRGKMQILTRQPVEGRNNKGGFRFGEMERDAILAHGAAYTLRDRLMEQSNEFVAYVCSKCGYLVDHPKPNQQQTYCRYCHASDGIKIVNIPYCFKLLIQELNGCHIGVKLSV